MPDSADIDDPFRDWRAYKGPYPKARFDVISMTGELRERVWPNACRFAGIKEEDVAFIRPASILEDDEPTWEEHASHWGYDPDEIAEPVEDMRMEPTKERVPIDVCDTETMRQQARALGALDMLPNNDE